MWGSVIFNKSTEISAPQVFLSRNETNGPEL